MSRSKQRRIRRGPHPLVSVDELCARAGALLRRLGFVPETVSMKSEAVYYHTPGRTQRLRVAAHAKSNKDGLTVSCLTFMANPKTPGHLRISHQRFLQQVSMAIGWYMVRVVGEHPHPEGTVDETPYL